jgi:antitoxin component YwqK of YwqJK toxin-antitoxin module
LTDEPIEDVAHFPNGRLKYAGFRLAGEMHGEWAWYRTDGSLMRTGAFDRGRQIGPWRTVDRDGNLLKETMFGEGD